MCYSLFKLHCMKFKGILKLFLNLLFSLFLFFTVHSQPNHLKIILMAGQSNMVGVGNNLELPLYLQDVQIDVPIYVSLHCDTSIANRWTLLQPGDGVLLSTHGCELSFAYSLKEIFLDDNFAIIKCSLGGSILATQWTPPSTGTTGICYTYFINIIDSALKSLPIGTTYEIAGMLWMQGESDAMYLSWANNYEYNLAMFISDLRKDLVSPNMPFIIGEIDQQAVWRYNSIIRQADENLYLYTSYCNKIDTRGFPTDGIHYTSSGYVQMGNAFADALRPFLKGEKIPIGNMKIFPNPASDYIIIQDIKGEVKISINDINGKEILRTRKNSNGRMLLNIKSLISGIYFIELSSNETHSRLSFIKK